MYYSWPPLLKRLGNRCLRAWPSSPTPPPQLSKMIELTDDAVLGVGNGIGQAGGESSAMATASTKSARKPGKSSAMATTSLKSGKPQARMRPLAVLGYSVAKGGPLCEDCDFAYVRAGGEHVTSGRMKGFRLDRPLRVGTDCSGLGAVAYALRDAGIPHTHAFASDSAISAQKVLMSHHTPGVVYRDVRTRCNDAAPKCDLYVFGPPCQSYSPLGLRRGEASRGGQIVFRCLEYVKSQRPSIVIFENVRALLTAKHAQTFKKIVQSLKSMKYTVACKPRQCVLNTIHFGIPQTRTRIYLVAIQSDRVMTQYHPPKPDRTPSKSISAFLDELGPNDCPGRVPKRPALARWHVQQALRKHMKVDTKNKSLIVDTGCSKARPFATLGYAMCLTRTRCASFGHYVCSRGRYLTLSEYCRLQGLQPHRNVCERERGRERERERERARERERDRESGAGKRERERERKTKRALPESESERRGREQKTG